MTWEGFHAIRGKKKRSKGNALIFDKVKVRGLFRKVGVNERKFQGWTGDQTLPYMGKS